MRETQVPERIWADVNDGYACRHKNSDYMAEYILLSVHQKRVERLRDALWRIYFAYESDCGCECDNENCCVVVKQRCAKCAARAALSAGGEKVDDDAT